MWLGPPYMYRKMTLLALRREVRSLRCQRIGRRRLVARGDPAGEEPVLTQQSGQGDGSKPCARLPEKLAARASAELT